MRTCVCVSFTCCCRSQINVLQTKKKFEILDAVSERRDKLARTNVVI